MAWLTLIIGGTILVIGLLGQNFGIRRGKRGHPVDRRTGRLVVTIGSTVVGLWIVFFSVVHLLHLHTLGH